MRKRRVERERGPRKNHEIRAPKVRVILDSGEMLGMMSSRDAYQEAQRRGLDLVEISPNANPPVCKLMDYGKYKYELKKKSQGQKKSGSSVVKEVTLSPVTQEHDLNFKVKNGIRFLSEGNRVKFVVRFRGRQMAHQEIGHQQVKKIQEALGDYAAMEVEPKMEGRFLAVTFAPTKAALALKAKAQEAKKAPSEKSKDSNEEARPKKADQS